MFKVKKKLIIAALLLISNLVMANELEFNVGNSILSVEVTNQQRGFLLKQIAKKMNHDLQGIENIDQTEVLTFDISGSANKVLSQLVSPASIILVSYSDEKKLTKGVDGIIWILPVGEEKDPIDKSILGDINNKPHKPKSPFRSKNMSESEWKEFRKQQKLKGKGIAEEERAERLGFDDVDD